MIEKQKLLLLASALAACGGPSATSELKMRVDESHLAPVPMEDRQAALDAEEAVFLATWQLKYTEMELSAAKTDVKVAKNDIERAKLSAKSAEAKRKQADETGNQIRIRETTHEEAVAALAIEVAEKQRLRAEQRVEYLSARLEAERLIQRREEARAEYAKATSMAAAGVHPPDFDTGRYKSQYQERAQRAKVAIERAKREETELAAVERTLGAARTKLERFRNPAAAATPAATPAVASPPAPKVASPPAPETGEPDEPPATETAEKPASEPADGGDKAQADAASSSDDEPAKTDGEDHKEEAANPAPETKAANGDDDDDDTEASP